MHVETIETFWVVLTAAALGWTVSLLLEARRDYRVVEKSGHRGLRWVIARASLRREILRVSSQAFLFLAGVAAMLRPRVDCPPRDAYGAAILFLFFGVAVLLLINTVLDARERHILRVSVNDNPATRGE